MLQIAVTGGIACGKSTVGAILSDQGAAVRDADDMAHDLLMRETPVSRQVIQEFGPAITGQDGRIDRSVLGEIVFADGQARERLNRIVHPAVKALCRQWLDGKTAQDGLAVLIVPLLYEAGMDAGWDAVVCVACTRAAQMQRLALRGLSGEQAARRIAAQMDLCTKMRRADYVIFNDGGMACLTQQTERIRDSILKRNASEQERREQP